MQTETSHGARLRANIVSLAVTARTAFIWSLWILLAVTWVSTLMSLSAGGNYRVWIHAGVIALSLYVLFFAEGLELAVTDLLDKHPHQLRDRQMRTLLQELQCRRDFFLAQRQVFVVVIISLMSLMTAYPYVWIPFLGPISEHDAPFWFSLVFTTLTVLPFCQVTPKRLAVMNSELFLRQSVFLWPLIKFTGLLGLPSPSDGLVRLFEQYLGYRNKRHLRPSPAAHYNTTSHIYGLSIDRIHVDISIDDVDTVTIRKRFSVLFLGGKRSHHSESIYLPSPLETPPTIKMLGIYTLPAVERLETCSSELDAIFFGNSEIEICEARRIKNWPFHFEAQVKDDLFRGGQWASWTIWSGRPLPEAFWIKPARGESAAKPLVALVYEVEAKAPRSALTSLHSGINNENCWPEHITAPCRCFSLQTSSNGSSDRTCLQGCDVRLYPADIAVPEETARCSELAISALDGRLEVSYPLQGSVYTTRWWQMEGELMMGHALNAAGQSAAKSINEIELRTPSGQSRLSLGPDQADVGANVDRTAKNGATVGCGTS
jgi:hypothetical protein